MIQIRKEEIVGWRERRLGDLVHRTLELVLGWGLNWADAIEKASVEVLSELEREEGKQFLTKLFSRVREEKDWKKFIEMLSGKEKISELDILGPEGQRFRVDLLLIGSPVIVVDYKYAQPRREHQEQVKIYCNILQSLFDQVEGYLLYLSLDGVRLEKAV